MNRVLRLLLGPGRMAAPLRAELEAEGLVLLEEGLLGSITFRNYRARLTRISYRKELISGAIAVTGGRLVVWVKRSKHIDIPLDGPYRKLVQATAEDPGRLCLTYDAGALDDTRSGRVEVRFRTAAALRVADLLGG
ncbi:hypothetical protein [Streptomyces sp. NPDC059063]|uniref:hypothetical protein n=1 Tax=unclassified Streptomyces TaxID=2593676 RepID=UPI0036C1B633